MASDVFFWNMRASLKSPYAKRVEKLLGRTGFAAHVDKGELAAVKIHFGEAGVTSHVQPLWVKPVLDFLRAAGARPFLTDASTLYVGERGEAVSHAMQAARHGYDPLLLGAPVIIADGLKGASQTALPVRGGKHFTEAFIGADIAAADLFVSLNHFKGHEMAGFGGALKNIGMGSASKQGKMLQHVTTGPKPNADNCTGCGTCISICAGRALALGENKRITLDLARCVGCGACFLACRHEALTIDWQTDVGAFLERMMEYAAGVLQNLKKPGLHINFALNITPDCDCMGFSDAPVCPDIGILASLDPVAVDQACLDLVNRAQPAWPSHLPLTVKPGDNKFQALRPHLPPEMGLDYAERLGLGSRAYTLVPL